MRKIRKRKNQKQRIMVMSMIGCFLFMAIGYSVLTSTMNFSIKAYKSQVTEFTYTGDIQTFHVPRSGIYRIELWGASGGDFIGVKNYKQKFSGGNGAYTKGMIILSKEDTLYLYIGGKGVDDDSSSEGGYNGGGGISEDQVIFGRTGGGATDIRFVPGNWDNFDSLKSRIMVAAGGGGATNRNDWDIVNRYGAGNGGAGGELIGIDGETVGYSQEGSIPAYTTHEIGTGGTQTNGGYTKNIITATGEVNDLTEGNHASFGFGLGVRTARTQTGGGSGYYGGGRASHGGAGGGSSFISGHPGCNAISSTSTTSNITHTGQPNHYSGKVFTETQMIAGNKTMPNYKGGTMVGNDGNGYARITYLRPAK